MGTIEYNLKRGSVVLPTELTEGETAADRKHFVERHDIVTDVFAKDFMNNPNKLFCLDCKETIPYELTA